MKTPVLCALFLSLLSFKALAKVVETNAFLGIEGKSALIHIEPGDGQTHLRTLLKGVPPVKNQPAFQYHGRVKMICGILQGQELCGFTITTGDKEAPYNHELRRRFKDFRGSVIPTPSTKIISTKAKNQFQIIVTDGDSLIGLRRRVFSHDGLSPATKKSDGNAEIICEDLVTDRYFCTIRISFPN